MLGHFNVGVPDEALDNLHIHAKGLELGDKGVTAAMGRQQTDTGNSE